MRTQDVDVNCRDPFTGTAFTVTISDAEVYGGLWAVTPTIKAEGEPYRRGKWKVTHVPTGHSASRGVSMTKAKARKLARLLAETCDREAWDTTDVISESPEWHKASATVSVFLEEVAAL